MTRCVQIRTAFMANCNWILMIRWFGYRFRSRIRIRFRIRQAKKSGRGRRV